MYCLLSSMLLYQTFLGHSDERDRDIARPRLLNAGNEDSGIHVEESGINQPLDLECI